jgi:dienelactone hydrolase
VRAPQTPGTWPSPLTAEDVAASGVRLEDVVVPDAGEVWWSESRPAERGRTTVLRRRADGPVEEVLPASLDARTRVHEYGGRCWLPLPGGRLVTSHLADQRLYAVDGDGVRALTPDTGLADRYGEPLVLPGGERVLCVRERVAGGGTSHGLVSVPLDGSGDVVELWSASDFVAGAAVSPDGRRLAFLTWDHPRMPWDGTELRVGSLTPGGLSDVHVALGGPAESVLPPLWDGDDVVAASDRSGWWNLVRVPAGGGEVEPLWPVEQECGHPMWALGMRSAAPLAGRRVAVLHDGRLAVLDLATGSVEDVDAPLTWAPSLSAAQDVVAGLAWTPTTRPVVVAVDTRAGGWREVTGPEQPDPAWAPAPERLRVPSAGGRVTRATYYPPTSPVAALPDGAAPPTLLLAHGGPTSSSPVRYSPQVAFFTSRGFAVVDVDYGGSTGYGRAYRDALRGQWGVVDVEDCEAVARLLMADGRASGVAIRGGSAGGWTVLAALTRSDSPFDAGLSWFGVADAEALADQTHDFESRYLEGLLGEDRAVWSARSPLTRASSLDRPVLLLQGEEDPVVPPAQAEAFLAALEGSAVPRAYLLFEGEAHGFRRAETVVAALQAELSFLGQVWGFEPPGVPRLPLLR